MVNPSPSAPYNEIDAFKALMQRDTTNTESRRIDGAAPPPPMSGGPPGSSGARSPSRERQNDGQTAQQHQPAAASPVFLRIDAAAQGFRSGGNSPTEQPTILFQVPLAPSMTGASPSPVEVTASFSPRPDTAAAAAVAPPPPPPPPSGPNNGSGRQQPHKGQTARPTPPPPLPQPAPAAAGYPMMPLYAPAHAYGAGPQGHGYYTTMVPIAMPGGYMGYQPQLMAAPGGLRSPAGVSAEGGGYIDAEAYNQAYGTHPHGSAQEMVPMSPYMAHHVGAYPAAAVSHLAAQAGASRRLFTDGYAPKGIPGGVGGRHYKDAGYSGGGGGSAGVSTVRTSNNSAGSGHSWSQDPVLPGTTDGPAAAAFHTALQEAAALNSAGDRAAVPSSPSSAALLARARRAVSGSANSPSGPAPFTTLTDLRGHLVAFSRDQVGSRVVQAALDASSSEEETMEAFEELRPCLDSLMADQFGNYVIQRLLETGPPGVATAVGDALSGRVLPYSLHVYGCRVVQKALEALPASEREALAAELEPYTLHCLGDQNANHVIQKCLETVQPSEGARGMCEAVKTHALTLARHSFGCRSVQRLLQHCSISEICETVISDVLSCVLDLTRNQFGNYVIQHLVAAGPSEARDAIMAELTPLASTLACHKFASNVMETCLARCPQAQRDALLAELLNPSAAGAPAPPDVARDQYGNYVLQRALEVATVEQREALVATLRPHLDALRRTGYGKHIAARVAKMNAVVGGDGTPQGTPASSAAAADA